MSKLLTPDEKAQKEVVWKDSKYAGCFDVDKPKKLKKKFKKDVPYLKEMIVDGMQLLTSNPEDHIIIRRYPNNIIKIHNKSISWVALHELLVQGDYTLMLDEKQADLFEDAVFEYEKKHGGVRIAGPGKTLGRNKIKPEEKKKIKSFGLSQDVITYMDFYCKESKISKSSFIESLIVHHQETVK